MNAVATTAAPSAAPRFIDNGDGTVTDARTGLMWSRNAISTECVDHKTAESLCNTLALGGNSDWRLPTLQELFAIADHSRHSPAIDVEAFPNTPSDWFWTSTECAWSSDHAWCVGFYDGLVGGSHRGYYDAFVRAVRAVPAGQ